MRRRALRACSIHATENFIKDLLGTGRMRTGEIRLGVVANKVRVSIHQVTRIRRVSF